MKYHAFSLSILFAALTLPVYAAQQTAVGKISFAKGSNAAQQPNAAPRLLGKDAEIFQGDNIQTSDASFVIVEFTDGSKVTIRPNSNFKIEQFDPTTKNAKLTVYEGTVRATTGEFAKSGEDNFQIKTPDATLKGSKDSDYSVSVCKENCNKEAAKDVSVAKVVDIKGEIYAKNGADKNAVERRLTLGSGLNPQDHLSSQPNSFLVMVFRDNQKVSLQPSSEFDIVKYDYQQADKKDQILFKLAAGGIRALTGSIGKKDHAAYALDTPVATIGIRGSEGDTQCGQSCSGEGIEGGGVYHTTTEGAFVMSNASGELIVGAGQSAVVTSPNAPPVSIPVPPPAISNKMKEAPPAKTGSDASQSFKSTSGGSTGIKVNTGTVTVASKSDEKSDKSDKSDDKSDKSDKGDKSDKSGNKGAGTQLSVGQSATTSASGETSDKVSPSVEQEFESTPAPNNQSSAAIMSSPINDEGTSTGMACQ